MLYILQEAYSKRGLKITDIRQFDLKKLAKIFNEQLIDFDNYVENKPNKNNFYFIDFLYDVISKKNKNVDSKINKLFSKFYQTIAGHKESSEMKIFCRLMSYTNYGTYEIISTYKKLRTLLFQGFHKKIDNEALLNSFMVNKEILKAICEFFKLNYEEVKVLVKDILQGNYAYGDDLVLGVLEFIYKGKFNEDPFLNVGESKKKLNQSYDLNISKFSATEVVPSSTIHQSTISQGEVDDISKVNWIDKMKRYLEIKFNFQVIREETMSNTKLSARVVYLIMTDKYQNGAGVQQNSENEDEFVQNFEKLSQDIIKIISPTMGTRKRAPPEKEKKKIDQAIRMLYNKTKVLFEEVKKMHESEINTFEKYKKLNNAVKHINVYTYQRNDLMNSQKAFFGPSDILRQHFQSSPNFDKSLTSKIEEMVADCETFQSKKIQNQGHSVPERFTRHDTVNIGGQDFNARSSTREPTRNSNLPGSSERDYGRQRSISRDISNQISSFGNNPRYSHMVTTNDQNKDSLVPHESNGTSRRERGIDRKEAIDQLQQNKREYVQQLGNLAINTWYPPQILEEPNKLKENPKLSTFNNLKKKYNNEMMDSLGEKPAVIMHSPQYRRNYNMNRELPLNLRCVNKLKSGNSDSTIPTSLKESIIFRELMELSVVNPILLKDLSLKEFKWKKHNKLVMVEEIIIEDDEQSLNSEDEEFYGRKTIRGSIANVVRNLAPETVNQELKNYKKLALYAGCVGFLNHQQLNQSCVDFNSEDFAIDGPVSEPRKRGQTISARPAHGILISPQPYNSNKKSQLNEHLSNNLNYEDSPLQSPDAIKRRESTASHVYNKPPLNPAYIQLIDTGMPPPPIGILGGTAIPPPPIGILGGTAMPPPPIGILGGTGMPPPPIGILGGTGMPPPPIGILGGTGMPPPPIGILGGTGMPPPPMGILGSTGMPPPPMGILGGTGLPPPPMGGILGVPSGNLGKSSTSNLNQNTANKTKMKVLMWDKVTTNFIMNSIWKSVSNTTKKIHIPFEDLETLFEDKRFIKQITNTKKEVIKEEVSLIDDPKRVQQLQIGVKKLKSVNKLNWEQIRDMITNIDDSLIGQDQFSTLKNFAPIKEELESQKNYTGDIEKLDQPSRWVYEMRLIPRFKTRIENYIDITDFHMWYEEKKEIVDKFENLFKMLSEDERWIHFLKIILETGNRITKNTKRGDAIGIKCITIKAFLNCRSNDGSCTLMEYIIREVFKEDKELFNFAGEFAEKLKECVKYNTEDNYTDICKKKSGFNKMKVQIEGAKNSIPPDSGFIDYNLKFFAENVEFVQDLEKDAEKVHDSYFSTMKFLGELEAKLKDTKSDDYLKDYLDIFEKIDQAYKKMLSQVEKQRKEDAVKRRTKTPKRTKE